MTYTESYRHIRGNGSPHLLAAAQQDSALMADLTALLYAIDACRGVLQPLTTQRLADLKGSMVWVAVTEPNGILNKPANEVLLDDYDSQTTSASFEDASDAITWVRHKHSSPVVPLEPTEDSLWGLIEELGLSVSKSGPAYVVEPRCKNRSAFTPTPPAVSHVSLWGATLCYVVEELYPDAGSE